jgi:hypothetical protein
MRGNMGFQQASIARSEKTILTTLKKHNGHMALATLFASMRNAGFKDETLIRSIIWDLIAQARIERNADTISLAQR